MKSVVHSSTNSNLASAQIGVRRFVIITSQRTGSTLLARSLDAASEILCAGEIFHRGGGTHRPEFQYPYRVLGSVRLGRLRDRVFPNLCREHLLKFYCSTTLKSKQAVGLKVMISQLDELPNLMPCLVELKAAPIFLVREDDHATATSYYKAQTSGVYHQSPQQGRKSSKDKKTLEQLMQLCAEYRMRVEELHRSHGGLLLRYENLVANWDSNISRVGDYLGITALRVPMALEKLSRTRND